MMRFLGLSLLIFVPFVCAGERAATENEVKAELVLETIGIWGQSLAESDMLNSVSEQIAETGARNGWIAFLTLSLNEGGDWGCYTRFGDKALCNVPAARAQALKAEQPLSFEWQHGKLTFREYVQPIYLEDYDGTKTLMGVWRLGIIKAP